MTAPLISIKRHCIATDGQGVTTLVAFYGCTLHCRYCINPQCTDATARCREITPKELYDEVVADDLYFIATGGGITFGGGEPLLRSGFIREFCDLAKPYWNISLETSLNVRQEHLVEVMDNIDHFYIDIKDMDHDIYKKYTTHDSDMLESNLWMVASHMPNDKVTIRLPLIPGFNDRHCRENSIRKLRKMGFKNFDLFTYIIHNR